MSMESEPEHFGLIRKLRELARILHPNDSTIGDAKLRDLAQFLHAHDGIVDDAAAALNGLQFEVIALREDAARYRWLVANARLEVEEGGGRWWSLMVQGPPPTRDALKPAINPLKAASEYDDAWLPTDNAP